MSNILYSILIPYADYRLIKSNVGCKSVESSLGSRPSLSECANACRNTENCHFFIYGKGWLKKGWCYWEKTSEASCPEGWENDNYDFYKLTGGKSYFCD